MKTFYRSLFLAIGIVASATMPSATTFAQTASEPAIVISLASVDAQMDDVEYLAGAAGLGAFGNAARMQTDGYLKGVDKTKPICALLYFKESSPEPEALIYVPVSNYDDFLNNISNYVLIEDEKDYNVIKPDNGPEMFVKEMGKYAVATPKKELFDSAPKDVDAMIGELSTTYNFGARVYAQRIPAELREQGLSMIENSYREQIENMAQDDLAAELQLKNFEMQMKQMRSLFNETDQLVLGVDFDKANKNIHLDMQMVGLDGSILAKQSENYQAGKSTRFAGFLMDGATFTANAHGKISPEDQAQYKQTADDLKKMVMDKIEEDSGAPEEELAMAKDLLNEIFGVLEATVEKGDMDMGAMVFLSDDNANGAVGMAIASPQKLEDKVKELVDKLKDQMGDEVEINLDCEKFDGVNFHEIVVQVPADEEEMQNLIGDEAKIYLGFGKDVAYVAFGNDPMETLKSAMNASKSKSGPEVEDCFMQYNLFLAPLLKKIASIEGEEMSKNMAEKLATNGRDRIRFTSKAIKNGIDMRFEIEDGFLELLGMVAPMMGLGGGGGADF